MFRIHFEPNGGYFCFQVPFLWLFWQKVKAQDKDSATGTVKVLKFVSYAEAKAQADKIGLTTLYEDRSADKYRTHMNSNGLTISQLRI